MKSIYGTYVPDFLRSLDTKDYIIYLALNSVLLFYTKYVGLFLNVEPMLQYNDQVYDNPFLKK